MKLENEAKQGFKTGFLIGLALCGGLAAVLLAILIF